jgi:hypothetical protein
LEFHGIFSIWTIVGLSLWHGFFFSPFSIRWYGKFGNFFFLKNHKFSWIYNREKSS